MESFFADKHNEAVLKKINLASFAININFDDYNSYCRRSTLYESLGLFKLSLDDAVKAISIDNQRDEGYLIQAKALTGLKKFNEAEKSLNECLSKASCNTELVLNQLENLRYLGVKEIGFDDQVCLLASRKFSTLNEAINGAFSMDLDELEPNDNTIVQNNSINYNNNNDCQMQQMSFSDNQSLISSQNNLMQIAEENPSSNLVENNILIENEANNECFSSDARWESESTVVSKKPILPQFTPVKDLISDIENDYFCNDFTSSPFTRNSNSSISFAETLTTPQLNKKDSSEVDQQVLKKPKVIKNLMKDLTENSENSPNQIESSNYSSPSKCLVSSPYTNIFSSPKSNYYSSPKQIQSPFKIVNTNNDNNINNNVNNFKNFQNTNNMITNEKSHQHTINQNKLSKTNSSKKVSPTITQPKVKPISTVQCPVPNDKVQITIVDFNKKKQDSEKSHQEISINKLIEDNALANNHSLIKVNNSVSNKQAAINEINLVNSQGKKIGCIKGDFENLTAENINQITESLRNGRLANFQTNEKVTSKLLVQRRLISEKMILDTKMCKIKINENKKRPLNNS